MNIAQWNCEWLNKTVIVYSMMSCYLDNCSNSGANTCTKQLPGWLGVCVFIGLKTGQHAAMCVVYCRWITITFTDRIPLWRRRIVQVSALSTHDGGVSDHRGLDGWRRIRVRFRRGSLRDGYHFQGRQQARKLPNPDTGR